MERPQFQNQDKSMGKPPKELSIKEEKRINQGVEIEKRPAKEPGIKGEKKPVEPYDGNRGYQYQ
jgi:hypothetical protein